MNFEISLFFPNQAIFSVWPKSEDKNVNILRMKKAFKMKSIFHHFKRVFSCQKLSQTLECVFKQVNEKYRKSLSSFFIYIAESLKKVIHHFLIHL